MTRPTARVAIATSLALTVSLAATVVPAAAQTGPQPAPAQDGGEAIPLNVPRGSGEVSYLEITGVLQPWLSSLPGVRAVLSDSTAPETLRLIAARDVTLRLTGLRERLNAPGADRAGEYGRFVTAVDSLLRDTDPFKPEAYRVLIRPASAIDEFELMTTVGGARNVVVRRAFAPGLEEVVVADTQTSIVFLPAARLADLQLSATAAFEQGRANLAEAARSARWSEEGGLRHAELDGSYETGLLTVPALWDQLEADMGGPVAIIVPTRSRLVIGRADIPAQVDALRAKAQAEAVGEMAISSQVLVRSGTGWTVLP
jgi:hypothetical protein